MPKFLNIILSGLLITLLSACNLANGATEQEVPLATATTNVVVQVPTQTTAPIQTATTAPSQTPQPTIQACTVRSDWVTNYTIVAGDTLGAIARRANTTIDTLVSGNCLANPNLISVGQVLRVPSAVAPATVVVVPTATTAPQQPTNCAFYSTAPVPIYYNQGYGMVIGSTTANQRYPVRARNGFNYRITLPDNTDGWVQTITGTTEGACDSVQTVGVFTEGMGGQTSGICYIRLDANSTLYTSTTRIDEVGTIPAMNLYRVDATANGMVRVAAGRDVPFPTWVLGTNGQLVNECNVPDVSMEATLAAAPATHVDTFGGFSFQYPSNWRINNNIDGLPGGFTGTTSTVGSYPGAFGWTPDLVSVSWVNLTYAGAGTPESVARAEYGGYPSGRLYISRELSQVTLPSGTVAWTYQTSGVYAPTDIYYFQATKGVVALYIQGNPTLAQRVLDTVRPQ